MRIAIICPDYRIIPTIIVIVVTDLVNLTMATKFHAAAKEGHLDPLREATKRDCNRADETGMTPTLWAATNGHIDALRLIVSRGYVL